MGSTCKSFFDYFKGKDFVTRKEQIDGKCFVDIKTPEFEQYTKRNNCETQTAYSIAYYPEHEEVASDVLVGHCKTNKQFQSFLLTPSVDLDYLNTKCKIEQVHIHSGKGCPTSHIHIECKSLDGKPPNITNIVWMAEKLDSYMKVNCEE